MTEFPRWRDVRGGIVAGAGGEEAIIQARHRNQAYSDGYRLAERRKALGQADARACQMERGEVYTIAAVARCVQAIGGCIQISAVFGDDHYFFVGPSLKPSDRYVAHS